MKTKRKIYYLSSLLIVLFLACTKSNPTSNENSNEKNDYKADINKYLSQLETDKSFMGSVSISKNGKEIYTRSIGYMDLENKTKSNSNTKYRIASITKTFTAVLIFKAIEEGKLELDQTIENFFPKLPNASKINIAHLLHHQSGIQSYTKSKAFWDNRRKKLSSEDLLNMAYELESIFEPGTDTKYSNTGYFLLSEILEKIYQSNYSKLLFEKITEPLQLKSTYVGELTQPENNETYSYMFKSEQWEKFPETHLSLAKGAGSLISTPTDLNSFFRNLFNGNLISESSLEHMKKVVKNHGMGIFQYNIHGQKGFGHGGNIDAFNALSIYFKDADLTLSITSNASKVILNEVYSKILELYVGVTNVEITNEELDLYAGTYISNEDSDTSVFERKENTLILVIKGEFRQPLKYKGNGVFIFNQVSAPSIQFTFSKDGKEMIFEQNTYKGVYTKK